MDLDVSDRIRERAYEIWMATGCHHGLAEQHWFAAEQEILARSSLGATVAHVPAKANKRRGTARRFKEGPRQ